MAAFRPHSLLQNAVLRSVTFCFGNGLIRYSSGRVAVCTPNAHNLPLSPQAQSVWLRPVITNLQLVKPCYEIVKLQNESFCFVVSLLHVRQGFFTQSVPLYVNTKTQDILLSHLLYMQI